MALVTTYTSLSALRRLRRRWVRLRSSRFSIPAMLLMLYGFIMLGLAHVADTWIVLLAATPLAFAALLSLLCLWLYRRDFYA